MSGPSFSEGGHFPVPSCYSNCGVVGSSPGLLPDGESTLERVVEKVKTGKGLAYSEEVVQQAEPGHTVGEILWVVAVL